MTASLMTASASSEPRALAGARLPAWALPADWPRIDGRPALADLQIANGTIASVRPAADRAPGAWRLDGAPLLPGLVDAHTHLDKTFTAERAAATRPGLLGAIEAMHRDRVGWTEPDLHARASRALEWACAAGVVHVRTHVDWWEPENVPLAWRVLERLADEWRDQLVIERVALVPLTLYADAAVAYRIAAQVARGRGGLLGGFVHTVNWNAAALDHLLAAADAHGLDLDLHVDEEMNPAAQGLATLAARVQAMRLSSRVVAGHACALAAQDEAPALATLDAVARAGIVLVTLPVTNLLLQDATPARTPRLRGLTLVKEARARGIPVLVASDNVQDAFCAVGSYDPVEALQAAVLVAQLDAAFDDASQMICRSEWLARSAPSTAPFQPGAKADFVVFGATSAAAWPARAHSRVVVRQGRVVAGDVPSAWLSSDRSDDMTAAGHSAARGLAA
jgi:cytosine deaminase